MLERNIVIRKRLGPATLEVLQAIASGHQYGFDIMDATGLPGGTVYPALAALERDGLVSSDWEDPERARADKRPPRRYYAITAKGDEVRAREIDRMRRLAGIAPVAAGPVEVAAEGPPVADPSPRKA